MVGDQVHTLGSHLGQFPPLFPRGNYPHSQGLTWKSSSSRISFRHLIKKAAQTYRWKCENPSGSDCGQQKALGQLPQLREAQTSDCPQLPGKGPGARCFVPLPTLHGERALQRAACIPGRCPRGGWCSAEAAPSSAGCSSSGRRTAGIRPRTS